MKTFVLCHPQSVDLLPHDPRLTRIACGTAVVSTADLSEANDFHPTYAAWNSSLFETSVILTLWEHAPELVGDEDVCVLHSDVTPNAGSLDDIWGVVSDKIRDGYSVGMTAPVSQLGIWDGLEIPAEAPFVPKSDPMMIHSFDHGILVWDMIRELDNDLYDWAMAAQPRLIYSHQFACSRRVFDELGNKLYAAACRLRLRDVGFWTPHVFERLIALYLARLTPTFLSTCFWHHSSSGAFGPGELSLYGPRPRKFYRIGSRCNRI